MTFEDWFNRKPESVPDKFHSFTSGKAFEHCMMCDKFLLEDGTKYMIEKSIKTYPEFNTFYVIFEYAICEECANKMKEDLSKESIDKIQNYFYQYSDRVINLDDLSNGKNWSDLFTNKCLIKNIPIEELKEYQIIAYCEGRTLSRDIPPIMLSEFAADEMQELISAKTRDELNKFTDDFLGIPPEWKEILKDELILI